MRTIIKFFRNNTLFVLLCVILAGLFVYLRFYNITIIPVFADEAIYIRWAQVMRAEPTLRFLPLSDGKQPLYMWLLMPIFKVITDPLVAGRFLSVVFGLVSTIGIFVLSWLLYKNKWVSLLSSFFYTIVPFFVFFDRQASVDSALASFAVWFAVLSVMLAENSRLDLALIAGLIFGAGLMIKSPAIFFMAYLPLSVFTAPKILKTKLPAKFRLIYYWAVIFILGFGMYNFILRLGPGFGMIAQRNKDYVFSLSWLLAHPFDPLRPHLGDLRKWLLNLFSLPIIISAVLGIALALKKHFGKSIFLLSICLIPLIAQSAIAKVFTPRYILFTVWPLTIFTGFFLKEAWEFLKIRVKDRRILGILGGLGILGISWIALNYNYRLLYAPETAPLPTNLRNGHFEEWTSGGGIKEISEMLKERAKSGNVFVGTDGFFGTLPDGLQMYLDKTANITIIGVGVNIEKMPESLTNSLVDNDVYLVVNKRRLKMDPSINGLILIKEYPRFTAGGQPYDSLMVFRLDKNFWSKVKNR